MLDSLWFFSEVLLPIIQIAMFILGAMRDARTAPHVQVETVKIIVFHADEVRLNLPKALDKYSR
ncbi:hypothetical protein [Ferrimonas sp. SCSIO 43195]|uniref:hypothetical protein n=1 Tax=Ferrimonas sp. SCSIO 43195 TaxID=2822844 RepID=UPI00207527AD|nr:hypothetical protein [Ferrimonas sp. SCSIO 43195]USD38841.1 hypothetical protein J8Z22_06980 [Ferrimonas sp. SCSIO 43195]